MMKKFALVTLFLAGVARAGTDVDVPCSSTCTVYPSGEARRVFNAPRGIHVIDCQAGNQEVAVFLNRRGNLLCQFFWRDGALVSNTCTNLHGNAIRSSVGGAFLN